MDRYRLDEKGNVVYEFRWNDKDEWTVMRYPNIQEILWLIYEKL